MSFEVIASLVLAAVAAYVLFGRAKSSRRATASWAKGLSPYRQPPGRAE